LLREDAASEFDDNPRIRRAATSLCLQLSIGAGQRERNHQKQEPPTWASQL
jgi:hypothetical protein